MSHVLHRQALAWGALALIGCGTDEDCYPGFDAGEQFRVTVKGLRKDDNPGCPIAALNPGESFILTASSRTSRLSGSNTKCYSRIAEGVVPDFAASVITGCEPGPETLGITCSGASADGCLIRLSLWISPYIARGVERIDDGDLIMQWSSQKDKCPLLTVDCGLDEYSIRIERLGRDAGFN